ncbi:MAG: 30S ribosomal protein S17 [Desulfuromusa sp.]|jgi:small subunit ribosomal protein S17|nr:30S ribosomal protein S17 [Desulfuromusa sp.]
MSLERGNRSTRVGVVVSNKMDKTVVVRVDTLVKHTVYKKFIKRRTNCKAHDEANSCGIGDKVLIMETRPLSKDKRWRVRQVLEKAVIA